jgi:hypothetical protein
MGRSKRAEDAAMGLLSLASATRTKLARSSQLPCLSGIGIGIGISISASRPPSPGARPRRAYSHSHRHAQFDAAHVRNVPLSASRRRYSTQSNSNSNRDIAVVGGGLTGLTTAYYLAKQLPSTAKITLYEGSDRLGGWIRTDRVPVDVDGVKGTVSFERGPRTLSSNHLSTWRFDDLVLYDLVRGNHRMDDGESNWGAQKREEANRGR